MRIEKLTPGQLAKFPEYVDRWTKIGLSTEPANRPRAEAAIIAMYAAAKLPPPRIVWCGSPLSNALTRAGVLRIARDSVGASVRDLVWASMGNSVRDSVGNLVGASVRDLVRALVRDSVWDSVWDLVGASVRASLGNSVRAFIYGQHDVGWIAFYAFFREQCGLTQQTDLLQGIGELSQSAGWAIPHKKICWVSERHSVLNRNPEGRLHCETGPAIQYPDGWKLWYLDGVSVDEQIIMRPETQTIEQIADEPNEEVKRIRIERFGWERWFKETRAKRIDARRNDLHAQEEELYEDADGRRRIIVADPSTGRRYALGVPRTARTCEQAQEFLSHGLAALSEHRS